MQTITQHILTDQMDYQDTVVLNCQIRYPQLNASCNQEAIQAINQYYVTQANDKARYCRSVLYPRRPRRQITAVSAMFHFFHMNLI